MTKLTLKGAATHQLIRLATNLIARAILCYVPLAQSLQMHASLMPLVPQLRVAPSTLLMSLIPPIIAKSRNSAAFPLPRPVKTLVKFHNNNIEATYPGVASAPFVSRAAVMLTRSHMNQ